MTCRNRALRRLFLRLPLADEQRPGRLGLAGGDQDFSSRHVENGGCRGHLGCRQTAGGRPASVATGCAVASSPEEVSSSPSPMAALPPPRSRLGRAIVGNPGQAAPRLEAHQRVKALSRLQHAARAAGSTLAAAILLRADRYLDRVAALGVGGWAASHASTWMIASVCSGASRRPAAHPAAAPRG